MIEFSGIFSVVWFLRTCAKNI